MLRQVGEQNHCQPFEDACHCTVGRPEEKPKDKNCEKWRPEIGTDTGDHLRGISHAPEIGSYIEDIGHDDQ